MKFSACDTFQYNEAFIFQQESASCHVAEVFRRWLQDNPIPLLEWPGNSPDLNPIENIRNHLKKPVAQKEPSNKIQLIWLIIKSWYNIRTASELKDFVHFKVLHKVLIKSKDTQLGIYWLW